MIVVLVAVLAGGVLPAHMTVMSLAVLWAPWTVLAIISASALCRGHLRSAESSHYTLITAAIFTRALRCALHPSRTKFKVTPKAGVDQGGFSALRRVRLLLVVATALAGALVWRGLGLLGYVHPRPLPAWAATFAMLLGTWELYRVAGSLRTVFRRRQRRSQVRFACLAPAAVADQANQLDYGRVVDVSVSGVGLVVAQEVATGARLQVEFALPGLDGQVLPVAATVVVQSARPAPSAGWRLGTAITHVDSGGRHNLLRYCYVVHPCERFAKAASRQPSRRREPRLSRWAPCPRRRTRRRPAQPSGAQAAPPMAAADGPFGPSPAYTPAGYSGPETEEPVWQRRSFIQSPA